MGAFQFLRDLQSNDYNEKMVIFPLATLIIIVATITVSY